MSEEITGFLVGTTARVFRHGDDGNLHLLRVRRDLKDKRDAEATLQLLLLSERLLQAKREKAKRTPSF